jgi:HPt (histidine-containing phosphotransfer) domain-containing protein
MSTATETTTGHLSFDTMPAGPHSRAAIDLVHLARYTLGNVELEREILDLFAGQAPDTVERLRTAASEREWREAAHTLKGSARAVGAWQLAEVAASVERTDAWQTAPAKTAAVATIERALQETTAFIEELKASD